MIVEITTETYLMHVGIHGVEVCSQTTIVITNDPQTLFWRAYGLRLHIPGGSLPAGVEQCTIKIMVSLAGQYKFPQNSHLISAVYWLRCEPSCTFAKPISLEIQHCASQENITKLSFVKAFCSQKSLPYTFNQLPGGSFTSSSTYGVIKLNSFSGVTVVQQDSHDREYIAKLFYSHPSVYLYMINLVVIWNIEAHLTVSGIHAYRALILFK